MFYIQSHNIFLENLPIWKSTNNFFGLKMKMWRSDEVKLSFFKQMAPLKRKTMLKTP